jgi:xanthine dehydrogenase iron-sulfur cluster and FAD-binding subunit A
MADSIEVAFTVNRRPLRLRVRSDQRLVDVLRDELRLTGVKEGCGTGECGSCTVIVDGQAANSCLMMAYQGDGSVIETIEGLAEEDRLHPLQEAFIEKGGVQCGACIPGMILAGKALLDQSPAPPSEGQIRQALAGNLCRCTGYSKIVSGVARAAISHTRSPRSSAPPAVAPAYFRPRSLEDALEVLAQREGEARALAGGTDILVEAREGGAMRGALFDLTGIPELKGVEEREDHVWIGATVTHSEMVASSLLGRYAPALPLACATIGGPQIRNRGTLGGNLASAASTADTVPPLYAADAVLELTSLSSRRSVAISDFFTGPRENALQRDELILGVRIPKRPGVRAAFVRLGQRQGQAISKISIAAAMTFRDGRPDWVRIALGAACPMVVRAVGAEKALIAGGYDALRKACDVVRTEIKPVSDLRSTAEYRREMAGVLLERAVRQLSEA